MLEKLEKDEPLSLLEQAQVEEWLVADPAQDRVRRALQGLRHEEPSLEWRSRLNERLLQERRPARRLAWRSFGLALSGAACTIAIFAALLFQRFPSPQPTETVISADQLIEWHEEAMGAAALPADGSRMNAFASAEELPRAQDEVDRLLYESSLESL